MKIQVHDITSNTLMVGIVIFSLIVAVGPFASRRRVYAAWAKALSILVCVVGLFVGSLHVAEFKLQSSVSAQTYITLGRVKVLLVGIAIGMLLSLIIARPYQKLSADVPVKS